MTEVDLLIVGAGPVGLFGAYYAGFREMSVAVMDSLPEPGGQVTAMYPEKPIYDIAGFPSVKGRDLVAGLVRQAGRFDPVYLLGHRAQTLEQDGDRFRVTSREGASVECRAVLVTGGIGTFTPRPLPAGGEYEGRGLAYFVPRPEEYADTDVVIVGGGDSAFDWALALHPIVRSVTLVHRRETFRAHAHTVRQVRDAGVEILTCCQVAALRGEPNVESVEVVHTPTGERRELKAQRVIAALGFTANLGPLNDWGLDVRDRRHIPVDTTMSTARRGVFAAGDITDYPGKVRLIAVGFGEAATAVNNAAVLIDPRAALFPGHSTDAL
ncbi:NAD(P)/FAD-dependent oxidoreductase [Thermomonospora cellulosilytica]|uniref:Ferredoxin--NADP reductase n=1 Tax=Thermomonospora cellulosilytica TaxID=1411118 RepID=A0A7W3MVJ0_9ACTN|nr:NAD(P)/FAD-dependent oxidoreductase [Thermomonospora cellulosilytica]MBA9002678.1 thioredoxin reductase (NADPH) [Thermomonospora cellulosilytica]